VVNNAIAEVLHKGGARMTDLSGICVMAGPGSYTGLRIGLSTAKGLCYALEVPLYLQNNLEVLAADVRIEFPNCEAYLVVLHARSGEYFLAAYDREGEIVVDPSHTLKEKAMELVARLPKGTIVCGSHKAAEEVCLMMTAAFVEEIDALKAWISVCTRQILRGESTPLAAAVPFYLKAAFTTTPKRRT
jgi:tRNA threonylcarbamoyladenosine biosynthesis protein TsaB